MSSLDHLETDVAALERRPAALSREEEQAIQRCRETLDHQTCRICAQVCQAVCERNLPIDLMIHHDVLYEHYRNLGLEGFLSYPLTPWAKKVTEGHFRRRLEAVQSCTRCGLCEHVCPHGLPIMDMMEEMLENHVPLIQAVQERGWAEAHDDVQSPYWIDPKRPRRL
jgi:CO dehydrogenase/acetyl-CoA synthase alpha subunit